MSDLCILWITLIHIKLGRSVACFCHFICVMMWSRFAPTMEVLLGLLSTLQLWDFVASAVWRSNRADRETFHILRQGMITIASKLWWLGIRCTIISEIAQWEVALTLSGKTFGIVRVTWRCRSHANADANLSIVPFLFLDIWHHKKENESSNSDIYPRKMGLT